MIYLLFSESRQNKMEHLFRETETLKLIDISFQFTETYHLSSSMAYGIFPVKHNDDEGSRGRQLKDAEYVNDLLDQLKYGILKKNDMFPLLAYMAKYVRREIPHLDAQTQYLELVTSDRPFLEIDNNQTEKLLVQSSSVHESPTHVIKANDEQRSASTNSQYTEPAVDSIKIDELKERRGNLEREAHSLDGDMRQNPEAEAYCVEWEETMQYLSRELRSIKMQDFINGVIGDEEIPAHHYDKDLQQTSNRDSDLSVGRRKIEQSHVHHLRNLQYGTLRKKKFFELLKSVITDDQRRLSSLRIRSDHLERAFGSSVYIVGEIDADRSFPVTCPAMTLSTERVCELQAVTGDNELVNRERSGRHHTHQFQRYLGTCSLDPINLPLSPSTPITPTYWETHTRLQVKGDVSRLTLLEMGVTEEGQLDTLGFLSEQLLGCQG